MARMAALRSFRHYYSEDDPGSAYLICSFATNPISLAPQPAALEEVMGFHVELAGGEQ